jgi:probable HAF family extracellular repeat protein
MKIRARQVLLATLAASVASIYSTADLMAQTATVTRIPTLDPLGTGQIYPLAISNTGTVTGYYEGFTYVSGGGDVAQTFTAQVTGSTVAEQNLGYIGGNLPTTDANFPNFHSWGTGVNGTGTVVGIAQPADRHDYWDLAQYSGGAGLTDLGNIAAIPPTSPYYGVATQGSATMTFAAGITNSGLVVGASMQNVTTVHAVVYQNGTYTDLSAGLGNTSAAYAANPNGTLAVGFQTTGTTPALDYNATSSALSGKVATEWVLSNGTWNATSLGTLNPGNTSAQSIAYGVNAAGQVIGVSDTNGGAPDAFLRQPNGVMIDLNGVTSGTYKTLGNPLTMGGNGYNNFGYKGGPPDIFNGDLTGANNIPDSINDLGQVVGYSNTFGGGKHAFLATVNASNGATMVDLNSLLPTNQQYANGGPWVLQEATGINDSGQIVGYGTYNGVEAGFALSTSALAQWTHSSSGSWGTSGDWIAGVPNGVGTSVTFSTSPGLTSSGTVTLDGNRTAGFVTFNSTNSYTISSGTGGTLTIDDSNDPAGASPVITVAVGSHTINAPISLATNGNGGLTINTWTGTTLTLGGAVTEPAGGSGVLTVAGNGNLVISPTGAIAVPMVANGPVSFTAQNNTSAGILIRNIPSLTIAGTTAVSLPQAATPGSRQVLVTTLNIGTAQDSLYGTYNPPVTVWGGILDVANNDLIARNSSVVTVTGMVTQAYNALSLDTTNPSGQVVVHGYYNYPQFFGGNPTSTAEIDTGPTGQPSEFGYTGGIISSTAANDSTHLTMLGVIQNTNSSGGRLYATFDGEPVSATDVLVKYTYYGDANLDGTVNSADYAQIDNALLQEGSTTANVTGWYNGDFNYDGLVNGSDYTLIDNAFNTQGASLAAVVSPAALVTAQIAGSAPASVPEPATLGLITFATGALLGRRKRR